MFELVALAVAALLAVVFPRWLAAVGIWYLALVVIPGA